MNTYVKPRRIENVIKLGLESECIAPKSNFWKIFNDCKDDKNSSLKTKNKKN